MRKWLLISIICLVISFLSSLSCLKEAELPILKTAEVSNIKPKSAVSGGTIIDDGGAKINVSGVCWGTADNPTIINSKSVSREEGNANYDCLIFGLKAGTYYHVRAFAKNWVGTAYGNEVHFISLPVITRVTTTSINTIGWTAATAEGKIECNDESIILERGFCRDTMENPAIGNKIICSGTNSGSYYGEIISMKPGTDYHLRAYAVTTLGITYGNDVQFTTQALPDITSFPVTEVKKTTARIDGHLDLRYDQPILWGVGICYGTTTAPIIDGNKMPLGTCGDNGIFSCTLSNLTPGTLYYVRTYFWAFDWGADFVIAYSNEVTFTTSR